MSTFKLHRYLQFMGDCDKPVVCDLKADGEPEVLELESVCIKCFENGTTRLFTTRIAYFREIIICSFSCPHCGYENRSLDPASRIQDKGQRVTLKVENFEDLNRRIVQPAGSSICLPEFDSSFPVSDGVLSTIEGCILRVVENLEILQPERRQVQPELANKLEVFIDQLHNLLKLEKPFVIVLDDPSGNGFIENYLAPNDDPNLEITSYVRTPEQDSLVGLPPANSNTDLEENNECDETDEKAISRDITNKQEGIDKDEVLSFQVNCPSCNSSVKTKMKVVDIPHFKEVVLMAINCSSCGYKDCEVRSGGGISPKGRRYKLKIKNIYDLSRDILLSENASLTIPELDFESLGGTLGGRFTTVEGLLVAIKDQLISANPFITGDSTSAEQKLGKLGQLIENFENIISGKKRDVVLELVDPGGNSYVQNLYAPDPDPELEFEEYERTNEENENLGLNDMNTTDYESNKI